MKFIYFLLLVLFFVSCKDQSQEFTKDEVYLNFSTDTVSFDTLFVNEGSYTGRLLVYNPSKNAVKASVSLGGKSTSPYKMIVNGIPSNDLKEITLLGKDSMLVLVDVKINPSEVGLPFLVKDSIVFEVNGIVQNVKLIAYGQNAHFLGKDHELTCDEVWENDKPYVVTNTLKVPQGCTFTVREGVKIYFDKGAKLLVDGSLQVLGSKDSLVRFLNENNLSIEISEDFGHWGGIEFTDLSSNNHIQYTQIENTTNGISVKGNLQSETQLTMLNTKVVFALYNAIEVYGANIDLENVLVFGGLKSNLSVNGGGTINVDFSTLYNSGFSDIFSGESILLNLKDEKLGYAQEGVLNLRNSIIWGNQQDELLIEDGFEVNVNHSLVRVKKVQLTGESILNEDPKLNFKPVFVLVPDSLSPVVGKAQKGIPIDLLGKDRDANPDLGAFEFVSEGK